MYQKITIIGAGNSGLAMAAHLALEGHQVRLWNRSSDRIAPLEEKPVIFAQGVISGEARLELATTDPGEALADSKLVLVTTPASAHADIASRLAPYLNSAQTVILNPGRTCGALEFSAVLRKHGVRELPVIGETQTIIYTCRGLSLDSVSILALKKDVLLAGIPPVPNGQIIRTLPECLRPYFKPARSMIETSIGNVGMILHCAPVLMNAGWIECQKAQFKYYYEGITPTVAGFLEKMDIERVTISRLLGQEVESTAQWLKRSYSVTGDNLFQCIQNNDAYRTIDAPTSLQHRYLFEDVPCGLVPLEAIGKLMGHPTPNIALIIDLANQLLNRDFRKDGRNLLDYDPRNLAFNLSAFSTPQ